MISSMIGLGLPHLPWRQRIKIPGGFSAWLGREGQNNVCLWSSLYSPTCFIFLFFRIGLIKVLGFEASRLFLKKGYLQKMAVYHLSQSGEIEIEYSNPTLFSLWFSNRGELSTAIPFLIPSFNLQRGKAFGYIYNSAAPRRPESSKDYLLCGDRDRIRA